MPHGTSNPLNARDLNTHEGYILAELAKGHAKHNEYQCRPAVNTFVKIHFTATGQPSARAAIAALYKDGYLSLTRAGRRMFLTDDQFHVAAVKLGLGHLTMPETKVPVLKPGVYIRVNDVLDPGDDLPVNRLPGDCRPGERGQLDQLVGKSGMWTYWLVNHGKGYKCIYSDAELTAEPLPVPAGLAVYLDGAKKPVLTWTGVAESHNHRVERRFKSAKTESWLKLCDTNDESYTDDSAKPGFAYEYRIVADLTVGRSASDPIEVYITPSPQPAASTAGTEAAQSSARKPQPGPADRPARPDPPPYRERRRVVDI